MHLFLSKTMASIAFEEVRKVYDNGHLAVDRLNFTIEDGELMALVGPSGCGKSTTLRMIAGLESVTGGFIRIDDRVVNDIPSKDRDVAMVFQNHALYPHMTVFNNIAFGLKLRKYQKAEIRERVGEIAEILGITDILDRKPRQLSGGEQQRVAVGRAFVRKPKVFLLDEPLSNLDANLRVQMRTELAYLQRKMNATMIYVTHDQTEAMSLGDRIAVMSGGVIQQIDDPVTLYSQPQNRFVAGFIGNPGMNFMNGSLEKEGGGWRFISQYRELCVRISLAPHAVARDHHQVVLGFRPEHVKPVVNAHADHADGIFEAEVVFEEHLGAESFVYAKTPSGTFTAKVNGTSNFGIARQLKFELDCSHIYLFASETDNLIPIGHNLG